MVTATVMSSRHCEGAADLLSREWPKRSRTARCREFRKDVSGTDDRVHLVLLDEDEQVVGYASLRSSSVNASEAEITSVCVHPKSRSQGLGRKLMAFVEHTAAERGYAFSMLWTSSSTSRFYASLGYAVIKAPPKPLSVDTSQLEALLVARTGDVSDVIYMRKRLLDRCRRTRCVVSLNLGKKAVLAVKECPWERQVGPSCGLFALRIAAEIVGGRVECDLLGHARRMGFTAHGELFDASHLVRLAEYLGLGSTLIVDDDWREILPAWFKDGEKKLAIFAYDQGSTHAPVLRSGLAAHYALVLGYIPSTAEVVVVHGLSRVPLVASIDDFIASNDQLSQLNLSDDEDGLCPRSSWVTPASGKPLLARRLVLLESPSSTEKNIVH